MVRVLGALVEAGTSAERMEACAAVAVASRPEVTSRSGSFLALALAPALLVLLAWLRDVMVLLLVMCYVYTFASGYVYCVLFCLYCFRCFCFFSK